MMKILLINGSMRRGNTYTLAKEISSWLSKKGDVQITEMHVADLGLPFCRSCHACLSKGEEHCPHHDIAHSVETALLESDGIILCGVTYMWSLNAAMKNLLDHFAYLFHRPALFGKKGMVITTSAGVGEKSVAKYMKTVLGQWGVNGAIVVTQTTKEHRMQTDGAELTEKEIARLATFAERFYNMIKANQQIPPSLKNIAVHSAFRAMSLSEFSESECDTRFWSGSGFVDKVYPAKTGVFKYLVGFLVYSAAKKATSIIGNTVR